MKKLVAAFLFFTITSFADDTITVTIDGMTCPACAAKVEAEIQKTDVVSDIDIVLSKGTVKVTVKKNQTLSDDELKLVIKKAGYAVRNIER